MGGGGVRVVLRPRQPVCDLRHQPARPERPDHVRAQPRAVPRPPARLRVGGGGGGRPRREGGAGSVRARARDERQALRHRGAHHQGQGRVVPREQGRLARQGPEEGRRAGERARRAGRHVDRLEGRAAAVRALARARARRAARAAGLQAGAGSRDPGGLRDGARRAGEDRSPGGGPRRRRQELHLQRQVQGGGPRAVRRGVHRRAEHGGRRPRHVDRGEDPVRVHLRVLPDARLRLHPHGRLLAAVAPRAVRQPRRRLHRRGRTVADGARGPRDDAPPCFTRATP